MSDDEKPSPEELERRRRWFDGYVRALDENSVVRPVVSGKRWACPCCRFLTLRERGGFNICQVCFWEDDEVQFFDPSYRGGANKPKPTFAKRIAITRAGKSGSRPLSISAQTKARPRSPPCRKMSA